MYFDSAASSETWRVNALDCMLVLAGGVDRGGTSCGCVFPADFDFGGDTPARRLAGAVSGRETSTKFCIAFARLMHIEPNPDNAAVEQMESSGRVLLVKGGG